MRRLKDVVCQVLVLFILFLSCSAPAWGAEWILYFESANGSKNYIDKKSMVYLPNQKVRAWQKTENMKGKGTLSLVEIDCMERKYTIRAMEPIPKNDIAYAKALNSLLKTWIEPNQLWEYIGTSDIQEAEYNAWCENHKPL